MRDPLPRRAVLSRVGRVLIATSLLGSGGCRRKDEIRKDDPDALELVYEVDVADGQSAVTAAAAMRPVLRLRARALGLVGVTVGGEGATIVVRLTADDARRLDDVGDALTREGRLEFSLLLDRADVLGAAVASGVALPPGASLQVETVPAGFGPGGGVMYGTMHFLRLVKQPNESLAQACDRLRAWLASLSPPLPKDARWVLGFAADVSTGKHLPDAVRTYVASTTVDVSDEQIAFAEPTIDLASPRPEPLVAITFDEAGTKRFRAVTAANTQRRFAILLDAWVQAAPVILGTIGGGRANVTLGSEPSPDEARSLAAVLRSHRLPGRLRLSSKKKL